MIDLATAARSLLPELSEVVKCGVNVLMWAGDADSVCDWMGSKCYPLFDRWLQLLIALGSSES